MGEGRKEKQKNSLLLQVTYEVGLWEPRILFRNRCVPLLFSPKITLFDEHLSRTVISQNAKGQTTFNSHQLTLSQQILNFQEPETVRHSGSRPRLKSYKKQQLRKCFYPIYTQKCSTFFGSFFFLKKQDLFQSLCT